MTTHNSVVSLQLLDEPLLSFDGHPGERNQLSLPGVLARLASGEPTEFAALQSHQQHAWYAFLVQLAALTAVRNGWDTLPGDEPTWRAGLVATAAADGAGESAFALVASDLSQPAFLQPAIPSKSLTELKNNHERPSEELDILVTSKNHDVKIDRVREPTPELWIYALVTLQTMQGFLGAGNYGISRMNGGFASRPCVAFAPDMSTHTRFLRDVKLLLRGRAHLISDFGYAKKQALGLVWCRPWDGQVSLPLSSLDPFFIEVCRRLRCTVGTDGHLKLHRGSSKVARIKASESGGNTGDAWTPVSPKEGTSLTMPEAGFTYNRVQDFLFGDWKHGAAGEPQREDGTGTIWFLGQVLVRGQGKTGGYHERWIPIPAKARHSFALPDERARLGERSRTWVELAAAARLKILKPAILTLLQGGPEKLKFDDDRANPTLARFERRVDGEFFRSLFATAAEDEDNATRVFENILVEILRDELQTATTSLPLPSARRLRAIARAERTLEGGMRTNFHMALFPTAPGANEQSNGGNP